MKNLFYILIVLLITSYSTIAQNNKPVFSKEGNKIVGTFYHDNGTIAQKGYYAPNGKLDGHWLSYDDRGNLLTKGNYNNGKKVGTWTFYQDNVKKEVTYANSKVAKVNSWKHTGTQVVTNK